MINQNSVRQRVRKLMELDTIFRDDDRYLTLYIWEEDGLNLTRQQKALFMDLPGADIIARRRREFSKEFPSSPEIVEKRFKHYKELTDEFSNQNWFQKLLRRHHV